MLLYRASKKSTVIVLTNPLTLTLFLCRSSSGVQNQPLSLLVQFHALLFWRSCAVRDHAGRASCSTFVQQHQHPTCFNYLVNVKQMRRNAEKRGEREREKKAWKQKVTGLVRGPLQLWGKGTQKCVLASLHPWSKIQNNEVLVDEMCNNQFSIKGARNVKDIEWNREVIELKKKKKKKSGTLYWWHI